jgi:predicted nucleotidyltransferase
MENKNTVNPLSEEKQLQWLKNRTKRFPLTYKELKKIYSKRWNYGLIDGKYFSIHPIRKDTEITENYGDYYYSQKGEIKGTATITDISESNFLPAIYKINESELDKNNHEISRIVSYEGLYGGLFNEGEKVEFIGNLEHVTGKKEYYQAVIGGAGSKKGYIKWT